MTKSKRVPKRLTDAEFASLLSEPDAFKLTILAHAALEVEVHSAILAAFVGEPPDFVDFIGFARRLDLAVAMGIVYPGVAEPLRALNALRNKFAHHLVTGLTLQQARDLFESTGIPIRVLQVDGDPSARDWLAGFLRATRVILRGSIKDATSRREEERRAFADSSASESEGLIAILKDAFDSQMEPLGK